MTVSERVYSIHYGGFKYTISRPIWRFQIEYIINMTVSERVYSIQYDGFKYTISHPIWRFQLQNIPANMTVSNTVHPIKYEHHLLFVFMAIFSASCESSETFCPSDKISMSLQRQRRWRRPSDRRQLDIDPMFIFNRHRLSGSVI